MHCNRKYCKNKRLSDSTMNMYEKAIEGRNFHYKNYSEWMNLYAIFTGSLFIGFYNVIDKDDSLKILICCCGILSSICWRLSLVGYYDWMKSWIKIVQEYEELTNKRYTKNLWVYSVYFGNRSKKQYLSTQKITKFFLLLLIFAWNILLACCLFKNNLMVQKLKHCWCVKWLFFAVFLALEIELMVNSGTYFCSDINEMKSSIYDDKTEE